MLFSIVSMMDFYRKDDLSMGTFILSLLMGPILILSFREMRKQKNSTTVNNGRILSRFTLPPPPPISIPKRKEFKLLRGYDKNR
jgi:hypothetical protein